MFLINRLKFYAPLEKPCQYETPSHIFDRMPASSPAVYLFPELKLSVLLSFCSA